jgi:hypothetical protein
MKKTRTGKAKNDYDGDIRKEEKTHAVVTFLI